jgi:uncharacterized protein
MRDDNSASDRIPAIHPARGLLASFMWGAAIGTLGGLIGLGGAEFRLPLLIGIFGFIALEAVIVNKAVSLVVVTAAMFFRTSAVPFEDVMENWMTIVNLLSGSLVGAWIGAHIATKLETRSLHRVIAILLVLIAVVLLVGHTPSAGEPVAEGTILLVSGIAAGFVIGVVASLLGVAGGELLIPTLVLLFGVNIKLAGSLSLAISLPTMLVGFARYSRDRSFAVLTRHKTFLISMATGSVLGAFIGGQLLGVIPDVVLLPLLAAILIVSAVKLWRHA